MAEAIEGLAELWRRVAMVGVPGNREYNPGWHTVLDLRNLLTVSEAIARSALERTESRGGHFREDYPSKDEQQGKINITLRKTASGEMEVRRRSLVELSPELEQIIEEQR
jgi:succinate dehydrogenase / fumarate reductase flavoprotein subunit